VPATNRQHGYNRESSTSRDGSIFPGRAFPGSATELGRERFRGSELERFTGSAGSLLLPVGENEDLCEI
jgi:hypothetical protein